MHQFFKNCFIYTVLTVIILLCPNLVSAEGEFSTSYDITYNVSPSGETEVVEKITLKNLTDKYYASNFSLNLNRVSVKEVLASDAQGQLRQEIKQDNGNTEVIVYFDKQITGKDKTYSWTVRFKSTDFILRSGGVYQVLIPKLTQIQNLDNYIVRLSVPAEFGDPALVSPEPVSQSESSDRINFSFNKEQLIKSGINATFGSSQVARVDLRYKLKNQGILPILGYVPLPAENAYQMVTIEDINPRPENVITDAEGNQLAVFNLGIRAEKEVRIHLKVKTHLENLNKDPKLESPQSLERYLQPTKYWPKQDPAVRTSLVEVFKDKQPKSTKEKVELINQYVVSVLTLDRERLEKKDFQRLGALTALNNPEKSLSFEYTDLFIALARAEGIPSRAVIGTVLSDNNQISQPTYNNSHVWPEYYDNDKGWLMIDPALESISGGINYLNFDLSHLASYHLNEDFENIFLPYESKFQFLNIDEFLPVQSAQMVIDFPSQIWPGYQSNGKLIIFNTGNYPYPAATLQADYVRLKINPRDSQLKTSLIPPFGRIELKFNIRSGAITGDEEGVVRYSLIDQQIGAESEKLPPLSTEKRIRITPLLGFNLISVVVVIFISALIVFYLITLLLHINIFSNTVSKESNTTPKKRSAKKS